MCEPSIKRYTCIDNKHLTSGDFEMKQIFTPAIHSISAFFLIGVLSSCSPTSKGDTAKSDHNPSAKVAPELESCDAITRKLLCVTDYLPEGEPSVDDSLGSIKKMQNRTCKSGHEEVKDYFMQVYKTTPETVQKLICNVNVIFLEQGEEIPYGGAVSYVYDIDDVKNEEMHEGYKSFDVKVIGQSLSINVDYRITLRETCTEGAQRRLNARFAAPSDSSAQHLLPKYTFENDDTSCDFRTTLIHEAGHIFDFANDDISDYDQWALISFMSIEGENPKPKLSPLFFSESPLALSVAKTYLEEFSRSPFVTFYAFTSPIEDFAEEFVNMFEGYKYTIADADGTNLVDIQSNNITVPSRKSKINFMKTIFNSTDIKLKVVPKYITLWEKENPSPLAHSGHDR